MCVLVNVGGRIFQQYVFLRTNWGPLTLTLINTLLLESSLGQHREVEPTQHLCVRYALWFDGESERARERER